MPMACDQTSIIYARTGKLYYSDATLKANQNNARRDLNKKLHEYLSNTLLTNAQCIVSSHNSTIGLLCQERREGVQLCHTDTHTPSSSTFAVCCVMTSPVQWLAVQSLPDLTATTNSVRRTSSYVAQVPMGVGAKPHQSCVPSWRPSRRQAAVAVTPLAACETASPLVQ